MPGYIASLVKDVSEGGSFAELLSTGWGKAHFDAVHRNFFSNLRNDVIRRKLFKKPFTAEDLPKFRG